MFLETFQTTFFAVFQVLLLAVSGYVLVRRGFFDERGLNQLSGLVINFLLPLFIYYQMTTSFDFDGYPRWWIFPLMSFGVTLAGFVLGHLLSLVAAKGELAKREFTALVTFQNAGNIPLMIVTTLFTGMLLKTLYVYILLFVIGFNLLIWSLGTMILVKDSASKLSKTQVLNPPFIATWFSLGMIYSGWHAYVPQSFLKPVELFGDCALPLAMLVVGGNLATIPILDVDKKAIVWVVLAKLIVMPLLALGVVYYLKLDFALGFLILLEAAVPCANSLSLITRYCNMEGKFINQGMFYGHVLSILTIPFFLTLYMVLVK